MLYNSKALFSLHSFLFVRLLQMKLLGSCLTTLTEIKFLIIKTQKDVVQIKHKDYMQLI